MNEKNLQVKKGNAEATCYHCGYCVMNITTVANLKAIKIKFGDTAWRPSECTSQISYYKKYH
jgi:hypothetical protein